MGTSGSAALHSFCPHSLAGGAVAAALALAPQLACADEVGESFWTPGSFGSLAATPSQPGFSLASTYYRTSTTAGSEVARARLIRIGRVTGAVDENVSAVSVQPEDLATIAPAYTFATPVLGGQAAVAVAAVYGRKRTSTDALITTAPRVGSFATTESRFDTISDTVSGFGDFAPQASLRWNAGVHNLMTYVTGNVPLGAYDPARLSNIGIGHGALDGGVGYTYFNEQSGYEFSAVGGSDLQLHQSRHPLSERRRSPLGLGSVAIPDQAAPDRVGGLPLQSGELRRWVGRPGRLLPVARCGRRRAARLHHLHGGARGKREHQSL